jgi:hypothetical protein
VHGEIYYGAHRLPAGKTAAQRRERGRPAGQAVKLIEDRQLQVSKAAAPFVKTANSSHLLDQKSTEFTKHSQNNFETVVQALADLKPQLFNTVGLRR